MWSRQTKNGKVRFYERYTDHLTGKNKDVSVLMDKDNARTRKEASVLLQQKILLAQTTPKKIYTLRQLEAEFLADHKLNVAESTHNSFKSNLKKCLDLLDRDALVDRITPRYIRNSFLASGKKGSTLNNYFNKFTTMWKWAYVNEIVNDLDILKKVGEFKDDTPPTNVEDIFLEADETKAVLEAFKKQEYRLIFKFLFLSGLRIGEAISLTTDDIDFDKKLIHINKNYSTGIRKVNPTKTKASYADVYMQPELEEAVRQLMSFTKTKQIRNGFRTNLLFCNKNGGHYNYTTLYTNYQKAVKEATGKDLAPHSTRHTHCALLFEQGFTDDQCQRRLRHKSSKVTREVYIHVTKKLKEKDAEQLKKVSLL